VFTGPSVGYLVSFPVAALVGGLMVKYVARAHRTRALYVFLCSIVASVLVIHPFGIVGMKLYFDVSWATAISYDAPFWIGDVLKTTLVALIAAEVHRAFPQLLTRR
jgi:biotin transport system substrate-specific component